MRQTIKLLNKLIFKINISNQAVNLTAMISLDMAGSFKSLTFTINVITMWSLLGSGDKNNEGTYRKNR